MKNDSVNLNLADCLYWRVRLFRKAIKISNGGSKPRILPQVWTQMQDNATCIRSWRDYWTQNVCHEPWDVTTDVNCATLLKNIEENLGRNVADGACLALSLSRFEALALFSRIGGSSLGEGSYFRFHGRLLTLG